eukprot:TRINITY_DN73632_c0_g1_i1.p1 TRINITY_DN73632_c0_g1~~TRINITY_DN73632_c0_g1_i1.p1  ORF type:complete len:565 (+),score=194.90 TRINITY_DN73632_c0_g1_i1:75-1769(+)
MPAGSSGRDTDGPNSSLLSTGSKRGSRQHARPPSPYGHSAHLVRVPSPHGQVQVHAAPRDLEKEREVARLETRMKVQAEEILRLNADVASRDAAVDELRRQVREHQADRQVRMEEGLRRELSALHNELEEKRKAVESLELATDASRTIADLREDNTRVQHARARAEDHVRHLEEQVQAVTAECATLKSHNTTLARGAQAEIQQKVREVEERLRVQHEQQHDVLSHELATLRATLDSKEVDVREYIGREARLQKEVDVLRDQCQELKGHGERMHALLYQASEDGDASREALREEQRLRADSTRALDALHAELSAKMRTDINRVVEGAERELSAVRDRCKQYESKYRRTKERLTQSESREEELRIRLRSTQELTEEGRERDIESFKTREAELLRAVTEEREDLTLRLSKAESELYTTRAALAEAKTAALMQYFNERGLMEQEMNSKADIVAEEVRSCTKLVRRMLERHTAHIDPPPGEGDSKLLTLKQLLLLLQSHSMAGLEDPPQTAPALVAWQERGKELLAEAAKKEQKADLQKRDHLPAATHGHPLFSSITTTTTSSSSVVSE